MSFITSTSRGNLAKIISRSSRRHARSLSEYGAGSGWFIQMKTTVMPAKAGIPFVFLVKENGNHPSLKS